RFMCRAAIEVEDSGWTLLEPVDHMEGPPMALTYAAQEQRADTPERLQRWLGRLAAYPAFIDAYVDRIGEARRQGILPARIVAERFAEQLSRRIAEPPEASPIVMTPPVTSAAVRAAMAEDVGSRPGPPDELLARMRADLVRALDATPAWFSRLPHAACHVEPLDAALESDSFGYYVSPTPDGSRPGAFYMNTAQLATKLFSRFATVTYHETIPGHHLQLATEAELPGLSAFRRLGAREACGAYVEGWALYTERLADELGLFRN